MEQKLVALTFVMIAIGALYTFDGLSKGELSGSVTGLALADIADEIGCYDTDARDYSVQGTTYSGLFTVNGEEPKEDTCEGSTLIEYHCVLNDPQVEFYDCPNGCDNGMCA